MEGEAIYQDWTVYHHAGVKFSFDRFPRVMVGDMQI